jgi:thymidine phosphorylase
MAAWCAMAGLRGIPYEASRAVVRTLLGSGDRLELGRLGTTVDIRTTGGVGDSALVVAASCIAAAAGVIVASTGTRSIAHVGGVLDAVAAVPGVRSAMSLEEYVVQARDAGMVIAEPGDRLVPDERRLARLRDATATADGDVVVHDPGLQLLAREFAPLHAELSANLPANRSTPSLAQVAPA